MKFKTIIFLILALLSACLPNPATPIASAVPSFTPLSAETSTALHPVNATQTFISTESPTPHSPGITLTSAPSPVNPAFCSDPQVTAVIDAFKSAMLEEDGLLLSSLVNANTGMDVRFYRTGNIITYSQKQAQFLFETTYQADWGTHPASGEHVTGAFHEVVVPELQKFLNGTYTLHCNELRHGGATYQPNWEYNGNFYVLHYPGSEEFGFLDWHSWVIGIDHVNSKPYIYALTQFFWEP